MKEFSIRLEMPTDKSLSRANSNLSFLTQYSYLNKLIIDWHSFTITMAGCAYMRDKPLESFRKAGKSQEETSVFILSFLPKGKY